MFPEGYISSKLAAVDHQYGNALMFAYWTFEQELSRSNDGYKKDAIEGLENARTFPDFGPMNLAVLNEIIQRMQDTNWDNKDQFEKLRDFVNNAREKQLGLSVFMNL